MTFETHLREAATIILESAIRIAPADARDWGQAMRGELSHVEGAWAAVMWALGGAGVMARHALISLFIPGRRGQSLAPDGGLFAKSVSLRKAALVLGGVCVLGALLFFAAPPFRQAIQVSLAGWHGVLFETARDAQPELVALSRRAEAQQDPEGLVFAAARLADPRESARLAEEAVELDPATIWVYAVVAVRHPALPQIREWVAKLESWAPQNALFPLITAESIDIAYVNKASRLSPVEAQKEGQEDPAWQRAMAAAFADPQLDNYSDRLRQIDRSVALRYRFNEPYELLSGEYYDLPSYSGWDSQRFAKSLLQSGQELEDRGDRQGALKRYWSVARFGQLLDDPQRVPIGPALQVMAYKKLQSFYAKQGNPDEAALFGYLGDKFLPARGESARLAQEWILDRDIVTRNAAVLQISSLMMIAFAALIVLAALVLIGASRRGARPGTQRVKPLATVAAVAGAVGFLISSATVYLTYRPYWYILQSALLNAGKGHSHSDLRNFLTAIRGGPDFSLYGYQFAFPFYFWMGVTLLGLTVLLLILLRHFLGNSRASPTP